MRKKRIALFCFLMMLVTLIAAAADEWIMPESLEVIGEEAFIGVPHFGILSFSDSLKRIEKNAFANASIDELILSDNIEYIDPEAFLNAQIGKVSAKPGSYGYNWAVENGYNLQDTVTVTITGDAEEVQSGDLITWTAVIPDATAEFSYRWILNFGSQELLTAETEEASYSFAPVETGDYTVTVFAVNENTAGNSEALPFTVVSRNTETAATDFRYRVNNGTATIYGYSGTDTHVVIPEMIDGYQVQRIENNCFRYNKTIVSIHMPDTVTSIGARAFQGCTAMQAADLSEGLKNIESNAFDQCVSVQYLYFPESLTSVGSYAFSGMTNLIRADLPDGITSLDEGAFQNCEKLASFRYPKSLQYSYINVFLNCKTLKSITVPEGVTVIPEGIFGGANYLEEVKLPSTLKKISYKAFENCISVTRLDIPDGLEEVGERAFAGMKNLTCADLPDSVTAIGYSAFLDCEKLESFHYPAGLSSAGSDIFKNCMGLHSVAVPEEVTAIPANIFRGANYVEEITLPSTLQRIGNYAFADMTNLIHADIPDGVTNIGQNAFQNCEKLESFHYPVSLTTAGANIFLNCKALETIVVPEGVASIPAGLFSGANYLTEVELPSTLQTVGDSAFANMTNLVSADLPDSVTHIGRYAFQGCGSLEAFHYPLSLETIGGNNIFSNCTLLKSVTVPEGVTVLLNSFFEGANCLEEVNLPTTLKRIGSKAFAGCVSITELNIPDGVEDVGPNAFSGMTNLISADLPDSVTKIGDNAYENCVNLTHFHYPLNLQGVYNGYFSYGNLFVNCTSLKEITVTEGVKALPNCVFRGSKYLEHIYLPDTLETIGPFAFYECESVVEMDIPDSVTEIGGYAFAGMKKLVSADLPDGVTGIGHQAFSGCESLTYFHYPSSLDHVIPWNHTCGNVFDNCVNLESIIIPDGVTHIPGSLFFNAQYLKNLDIPMSVTEIGYPVPLNNRDTFHNCQSIEWLYLSENVSSIYPNTFQGCSALTIECEWGTYALSYAQGNSIPYFYLSRTGAYSLNGAHWPQGTLYKGDEYIFDGFVRSSLPVTNITGTIYDAGGESIRHISYNPNETDNILTGAFTDAMGIGNLALGSYRFVLEASTEGHYEVLVDTGFRIVPPPLRVSKSNLNIPEGYYAEGESIPVEGLITTNYPISNLIIGAFREDGSWSEQVYSGTPGTYEFDLSQAGLDLPALYCGSYEFRVTVTGNGETVTAITSGFSKDGPGSISSVDEDYIMAFIAGGEQNSSVFYSLQIDFESKVKENMSDQEKFKYAMYTTKDKVRGEIIDLLKFAGGQDARRSEYLVELYKKQITSYLKSHGEIPDSWTFNKPDHDKLVQGIVKSHNMNVEDALSGFSGEDKELAILMVREMNGGIDLLFTAQEVMEDLEDLMELGEIFADALTDYSQGLQFLDSLSSELVTNADTETDFNFQLAVQELKQEYTSQCTRGLHKLIQFGMNKVMDEAEKEAIKAVVQGVLGGEVYLTYKLVKIAWGIFVDETGFYDDIKQIDHYCSEIAMFYGANRVYQESFSSLKENGYDETVALRMVNSFHTAKNVARSSIGTLRTISFYGSFTSDVTLDQKLLSISKLHCP